MPSVVNVPENQLIRVPFVPLNRPSSAASSTKSAESSTSSRSSQSAVAASQDEDVIHVGEIYYRHGRVEDSPTLTEIQYSNYRFHYSECAPREFLDNLDYPGMTAWHAERMAPPVDERSMVYVIAERTITRRDPKTGVVKTEPEVIGLSQSMPPNWERAYNHRWNEGWSQDMFDCEIDTLYVKLGVQGGGLGRNLVLSALNEAYDRFGMRKGVIIWTLLGNYKARNFYKKIGCEEAGIRTLDLRGIPSECVGYAFRSIGKAIGREL
ncbi:hypothetical protein BGW42_002180 [Actinomortierella wolfii]|nr:hypothetical protein BGW42_002180 [Actinomortierella wolfii]